MQYGGPQGSILGPKIIFSGIHAMYNSKKYLFVKNCVKC